jgi:hypothetical protein
MKNVGWDVLIDISEEGIASIFRVEKSENEKQA